MKKFFAIFTAVVLLPASQSMAWVGGPFSNNNPLPGGDDGVYEAVATMSNGLGIFRFGVRNNGTSSQAFGGNSASGGGATAATPSNVQFNAGILNAYSSNVWYYKGVAYYGTAFGMANSELGIVSAVGNATTSIGGEVPNPATGQVVLPSINGQIIAGPAGNNIGFANSQFMAKMQDKGPSFRFSGRGQVSFLGAADQVAQVEAINPTTIAADGTTITPLTINGVTPGNTASATTDTDVSTVTSPGGGTFDATFDSSSDQTSLNSNMRVGTGGESADFPQRGHVRKFLVFGSKVAHTVTP